MFRQLYEAKTLCGMAMSQKVIEIMGKAKSDDKFLILCEVWHMAYGLGIPEFLDKHSSLKRDDMFLLYTR